MQTNAGPRSFEEAVEQVNAYKAAKTFSFNDETLLYLYRYYKQATEGDVKGDRPGLFRQVARAKWDSWNQLKGKTRDHAKGKYLSYVQKLAKSVK